MYDLSLPLKMYGGTFATADGAATSALENVLKQIVKLKQVVDVRYFPDKHFGNFARPKSLWWTVLDWS